MHPIGMVRRNNSQNMVLIIFSIILAAIAVAISMTRCHSSFGSLAGSGIAKESFTIVREGAEQPRIPVRQSNFWSWFYPTGRLSIRTLEAWRWTIRCLPTTMRGNPEHRLAQKLISFSPRGESPLCTLLKSHKTTSILGTVMMPTQLTPHMRKAAPTARRAWAKL
jgi:hypothetical protein